jgi:hypothetical protein
LGLQSCSEAKERFSIIRLTHDFDAVLVFQESFQTEQEEWMVVTKQNRNLVRVQVQRGSSGLRGIFSPKPHKIAPFVFVRRQPI